MAEFLSLAWTGGDEPLIQPPALSPIIADPSFLFPEETPDSRWELYAHSAWGLHRYRSADGLAWEDRGMAIANAMRPCLRRLGPSAYVLLYEKYRPLGLPMQALPLRPRWRSSIELRLSGRPESWGKPHAALEPRLPWMRDSALGDSVSNPYLVEDAGTLRLYFSASLSWIDDCGFCEPRYIGLALSRAADSPFVPLGAPIIDPAADGMPGVIGAGSMKALRMDDGWIGLQNKIYRDASGKSRSAIFILRSGDGIAWESARKEPLVAPRPGWRASHVYACDCRFREGEGRWYLYFNARDAWGIGQGRERIGRLVGA
jgi:hypothetical protein